MKTVTVKTPQASAPSARKQKKKRKTPSNPKRPQQQQPRQQQQQSKRKGGQVGRKSKKAKKQGFWHSTGHISTEYDHSSASQGGQESSSWFSEWDPVGPDRIPSLHESPSRGSSEVVLADLVGSWSVASCYQRTKDWLESGLEGQTSLLVQGNSHKQSVPRSRKRRCLLGSCSTNVTERGNRGGSECPFSHLLQSTICSSKKGEQVEASHRPLNFEHLHTNRQVQNGDSGIYPDISSAGRMGNVNQPHQRIFSHTFTPDSGKVLPFSGAQKVYQFLAMPFGLASATLEFTKVVQEFKILALIQGFHLNTYLDYWINRSSAYWQAI